MSGRAPATAPPRAGERTGDGPGLAILRPYLGLLRGRGAELAVVMILMAVSTAVALAIPVLAGRIVRTVTDGGGEARGTPWPLLGRLVALLVVQLVTTYLYTVRSTRLGLGVITRLRMRLFGHLLELPSLFFVRHRGGDLASRMISDAGTIQSLVTGGLVSLARAVLTLVGAIAVMLAMNVRLTLVILALVPGTILLVQLFGRRLRRLARRMYEDLGDLSDHVQESVRAIRVIKVFNSQPHERGRFAGRLETYADAGNRRARAVAALESGSQLLLWVCLIAVVIYGFYLTARGVTDTGQLVTFLLLAYRVAVPMGSLTSLYASSQGAVAAAVRLDEILSVPPEGPTAAGAATGPAPRATARAIGAPGTAATAEVPLPLGPGQLTVEDVGFAYDDRPILQDISFRVEAGQWIGIVGPSGAGKTSLTGLVMGLFAPRTGRLLLDGRPYAEFDLRHLRAHMAYVSQEPVIYPATVADNIRFGQRADPAALREAARRAGALEFIERLPGGLEARCGEGGINLSGGERQRLALARAFLRDPRLLILDEPTSALDARSEEEIRAGLRELMRGRTALVVAHRLSLVRGLDRILVMADGRIVEDGSHEELLRRGGLYWTLHRLQHGSR